MDGPSRRAPGYDLFKLIVAMILLILFLLLNWRGRSQPLIPVSTLAPASPTTVPVSLTPALLESTLTVASSPINTSTPTVPSGPSPTETIVIETTSTPLPSPTATPLPSAVATPATTSTSTPTTAVPVASACESASVRSRLQNGMNATILRRLNFRSSPGIRDNWLLTNIPGTKVQIVGGPECVPHMTGAYLWWQIKLADGQIGWSAEASQYGSFYFMEPTQ